MRRRKKNGIDKEMLPRLQSTLNSPTAYRKKFNRGQEISGNGGFFLGIESRRHGERKTNLEIWSGTSLDLFASFGLRVVDVIRFFFARACERTLHQRLPALHPDGGA